MANGLPKDLPEGFVSLPEDLPEGFAPLPEGYSEIPLSRKAGERSLKGLGAGLKGNWADKYNRLNSREPDADYWTSVQDGWFRAGFSRMDTDEERNNWLDTNVGEGTWRKDRYGAYLLNPAGMAKIGQPSEQDVAIDGQGVSGYDIADWAGGAPAAITGFGAGMAMSGYGAIPGILTMALGGAAGKALDELVESFQGYQMQTTTEIAKDVAFAAVEEGAAEGVVRSARPLGRMLLGPKTTRPKASELLKRQPDVESTIDPERLALTKQAQAIGGQPKISQATGKQAPLLSRMETMIHTIFGDPTLAHNRDALIYEMGNLVQKAGKGRVSASSKTAGDAVRQAVLAVREKLERNISDSTDTAKFLLKNSESKLADVFGLAREDAGKEVIALIKQGRKNLSVAASGRYAKFDAMVGMDAVVPTAPLKNIADQILRRIPKTETGEPSVFLSSESGKFLRGVSKLGDFTTAQEMQTIRTTLREAAYDPDILPGVEKYHLGRLHIAANKSFDMVGDVQPYRKIPADKYETDPSEWGTFTKKPLDIDPEELKGAVKYFRETSKWYKGEIVKFDDVFIQKLTRDAHKSGAVDPDQVVDYIVKGGAPSRVHRIKKILSASEWKTVQASHFDSMLRSSEDLAGEINGGLLLKKVKNLGTTLDATYGSQARDIRKYATELAAHNGKIPLDVLPTLADIASGKGPASVAAALKKAAQAQTELDALQKQSFFTKWSADNFDPEEAADYLLRPKNSREIKWAKGFLGEESKEWLMLRESSMGRILKNMIDDMSDPVDVVLNGRALKKEIKGIGDYTLKEMFGPPLAKELTEFTKVAHFLTTKVGASGGIVAANIALHPMKNLPRLAKFFIIRKIFSTGAGVRYFTEGFRPNATKKAIDNLARYVASSVAQYRSESTADHPEAGRNDARAPGAHASRRRAERRQDHARHSIGLGGA